MNYEMEYERRYSTWNNKQANLKASVNTVILGPAL